MKRILYLVAFAGKKGLAAALPGREVRRANSETGLNTGFFY
jgi:hypothetical protein